MRIVRIPLAIPPDETWIELRRLAYQCAAFGNTLLTESYCKAKQKEVAFTTYRDFSEKLSAGIRDAVSRECVGIWRRLGKKILRGEQTLARFSADRALVVRDRAIAIERNALKVPADEQFVVRLRLHPKDQGEATELRVYMPALKRDRYTAALLEQMVEGEIRVAKATLLFERPGRKVHLLVAYEKVGDALKELPIGSCVARLGLDKSDEERTEGRTTQTTTALWLRDDQGHRLSLTDYLYRLSTMKLRFAEIQRRLRMSLGRRRRRGHRYELRTALAKAGSFETWAQGPLHQLSREIVDWCGRQKVSQLQWELPGDGELPWQRLRLLCEYKGQEQGLTVTQIEPDKAQTPALRKKREANDNKALAAAGKPERLQRAKREGTH